MAKTESRGIFSLDERIAVAERAAWVGASVRADIRIARADYIAATRRYHAELDRIAKQFAPIWRGLGIRP